jgi:hypothetical protein
MSLTAGFPGFASPAGIALFTLASSTTSSASVERLTIRGIAVETARQSNLGTKRFGLDMAPPFLKAAKGPDRRRQDKRD